jgi:hypothetical protein
MPTTLLLTPQIFRPSDIPLRTMAKSVRHKVFRKTGDMEDNSNAVRFKKHFFTVLLGGMGGKWLSKIMQVLEL